MNLYNKIGAGEVGITVGFDPAVRRFETPAPSQTVIMMFHTIETRRKLMDHSKVMPSGCREWQGASDSRGYGNIKSNRTTCRVHRVAYEIFNGVIPKEMVVRHTCDNPRCINYQHLKLGTYADNTADMMSRGRQATGIKNGRSKLTEQQIKEMRKSDDTLYTLAEKYGVDFSAVWQAKKHKTWKHIK